MVMKKLSPNLGVMNVDNTIAYYTEVLGFELVLAVPPGGPTDWAVLRNGDIEMMFQSQTSLVEVLPQLQDKEIGGAFNFYIEVEDIEQLYMRLKDKATIINELHTTSYGMQEFLIQDCNGFILTFGERK
ncbi:MAG: VOC family protein [Chloroflexota bacterium]|nr:VOC family protein [Chloroflexota bacterium]